MLVSFEGIDGCGKSTQIKLLSDLLENAGKNVLTIREPGGNVLSESIRTMLLSSKNDIDPITELLLFESARANLINKTINPKLKEGYIILTDRFYDSTTAYQGYGRGLDLNSINQLNKIATSGLTPDITFLLDVTIETSKKRSNRRIADRIESSDDEFYLRVIHGFHEIAAQNSDRVFTIDANNDISTTHEHILSILRNKFPEIK